MLIIPVNNKTRIRSANIISTHLESYVHNNNEDKANGRSVGNLRPNGHFGQFED